MDLRADKKLEPKADKSPSEIVIKENYAPELYPGPPTINGKGRVFKILLKRP
jgi:hypothetical protein